METIKDTKVTLAINQQTFTVKRVDKAVALPLLQTDRNDINHLDVHHLEGKAHFQMRGVRFNDLKV